MTDIVIYANEEVLEHKKNDGDVYWEFSRFPTRLLDCKRIFFAVKGFVVGSFKMDEFDPDVKEIYWNGSSWKKLRSKIPTNQFRGFRYKWW